jgi:hypothetical protein
MISGKRYLIVLDDVWNQDADKWGKLKTCLKQGGKGSAVLPITRDSKVAEIMAMGVNEAHNIEKLSGEHLREIVQSRAFSLQNPNSDELDLIFGRIVDRCAFFFESGKDFIHYRRSTEIGRNIRQLKFCKASLTLHCGWCTKDSQE